MVGKILLDTHIFLWWGQNDRRLNNKTRQLIYNSGEVWISIVSAWEFAIKQSLGKMDLAQDFEQAVDTSGFRKLPITFDHIRLVGKLQPKHRDPFDHMLVAQALAEDLCLVSHDRSMSLYDVRLIEV
jgi:PIN domain nuclease of toxin-antitoxin system